MSGSTAITGNTAAITGNTDAAIDFLNRWHGAGENRVLITIHPETDKTVRRDFAPGDDAAMRHFIDAAQARLNIYTAVNVAGPGRTSPRKAEMLAARALHIDADFDDLGCTFEEAVARLRAFDPPPTVIIFSGGGLWGDWLIDATTTANGWIERVEQLSSELHTAVGANPACHNVNRLMRLPGTVNMLNAKKKRAGRVPALARVVEADWDRRWGWEDPVPRLLPARANGHATIDLDGLPEPLRRDIESGDASRFENGTATGDRSRLVFGVACGLVRQGLGDEAGAAMLADPGFGISAHVRDQGNPAGYAQRQMEQARERVEKDVPAQAPNRPIEIIRYRDLIVADLTSKGLVKGLIDAGALALIVGLPGCGKTFLAIDLALSAAMEREWFGRKTRLSRVVYVAAEAGRSIRNRIAAWAGEKGDGDGDFAAVVSPVDLCHPKTWDVEKLIAAIGSADMVIIDTVSRALYGGNENAPDDMGAFITALDLLRSRLGCAVIAVHHLGKDASRGARGHSLLFGAIDTELLVEKRGTVSVATVTKQRDGVAGIEIAFRLRSVELGRDQDGDPVTSCVIDAADYVPPTKGDDLSPSLKAALDVLKTVVAQKGEPVPYRDLNVHGVKAEAWRSAMAANGRFGEEKSGQFRAAWKRARDGLAASGHVEFGEGYVWLCGPARADDVPF